MAATSAARAARAARGAPVSSLGVFCRTPGITMAGELVHAAADAEEPDQRIEPGSGSAV
jgi:hypothetical protein